MGNSYALNTSNEPVYKRVDTGQASKRFGWKLVATGVVALFLLVWALDPRELCGRVLDVVNLHARPPPPTCFEFDEVLPPSEKTQTQQHPGAGTTTTADAPPYPDPDTADRSLDAKPDANPDDTPPPASLLTFKTDPDHSKTVHCTSPYSPAAPLVQWALMIDAGSTGSRIHIYKFHNCGAAPEYEYEVFKMVQPGLPRYAGDADGAARSLDPLLEEAMASVPEGLRRCTPVAVKVGAALTVFGPEQSADIIAAVRGRLEAKYPFPLAKKDGVAIMDWKDSGVYAWATANYLLNTTRSTTPSDTPDYAVLDFGGASTHIVFKPAFPESGSTLADGEHMYRLEFGGREHVLYQHLHVGYGLLLARRSVHRLVDLLHSPGMDAKHEVANPCLARGTQREVEVEDHCGRVTVRRTVTMVGADVGSFEACNRVVELVMAKNAICQVKPCSFNGVYQPSLPDTFPSGKVLLLSYFYDRLAPLLPADNRTLPISTIATFAERVCLGPTSWARHWGHDANAMAELRDEPEYCLDLTFMHALLRFGFELEPGREVLIAEKVGETDLGWCLGATIALLHDTLECAA